MDKKTERGRIGEGRSRVGDVGTPDDPHQLRKPELRGDLGIGGQRHAGGSSRDPQAQGRRTKEEAGGGS